MLPEEIKNAIASSLRDNIDAVYIYLDIYLNTLTEDEIIFWKEIISILDNDHDNTIT